MKQSEMFERKKSFVLYDAFYEQIQFLSIEQRGQLFTAIFEHRLEKKSDDEILESLPDFVKPQFAYIRTIIDMDCEKYLKKCETNKEIGKLGGRPPKE